MKGEKRGHVTGHKTGFEPDLDLIATRSTIERITVMNRILLSSLALWLAGLIPLTQAADITLENTTNLVKKAGMVILGHEVVVKSNEIVEQLVVIHGAARVEGQIEHDLIVVGGSAKVEGKINGDLIVIGEAQLGSTAEVSGAGIVIGGQLTADPESRIGGERVEVSLGPLNATLKMAADWVMHGLILMRPFPPRSGWCWVAAILLLSLYLVLTALFRRPVEASSEVLRAQAMSAFLAGLLAIVLLGPLVVLLFSSVIGILAVPFVICGFTAALVLGKVVFYHAMGRQIGQQFNLAALHHPGAAVLAGTSLFFLFYMVPVLGFIVWGVTLPIGLGALLISLGKSCRPARPQTTGSPGGALGPTHPATGSLDALSPVTPLCVASAPRAGFWIRTGATVIDLFVVGALTVALAMPHFSPVLWGIYHVALWAWQGTTLGGLVFGLKVLRLDGRPLDFGVALVRALACVLSAIPLMLGFLWVAWDPEKQSWHDRISNTQILRANRGLVEVRPPAPPAPAPPASHPSLQAQS